MAKIYEDSDGDTCIRFDNGTGWWSTTGSMPYPLTAESGPAWLWSGGPTGALVQVAEVPESEARALAAKGGAWRPRSPEGRATSAQVWAAVFGAAYCDMLDASAAARTADEAVRGLEIYHKTLAHQIGTVPGAQ